MKSFLLAAALTTLASAIPFAPWEASTPPPAGTQFYQLQTKSSDTTANGLWVSLPSGATTYALNAAKTSATKFFLNKYAATGTYALHNSDDTRQVALQGNSSALLYAVDATNPSTDKIPKGSLMEWATFTTDGNVLGVKDGSALTNRSFVVVGTQLGFWDGVSKTAEVVKQVTINIVKA